MLSAEQSNIDIYNAVNTRLHFIICLQEIVNSGEAHWKINEAGQMELHTYNGEIYVLDESTVNRIQ